jgi:predicted DNA-binding transcriptional regulator YafY
VRADRLISLMLLLYTKGRMTAQSLARQLEVSERTIYRDLDALSTAGIPVYTQSGPMGGVYLDEQYRPALTGLMREDIQALFVTGDTNPLKDLGLTKTDSLLKLLASLPATQQTEVDRLRQRFHIDSANWFQVVEPLALLPTLQQAVWQDRRVEISYQAVKGAAKSRVVDAFGLVAKANIWYLVAKKPESPVIEMHSYRVARLQEVRLLDEHFERPLEFDLAAYWQAATVQFERDAYAMAPPYITVLRVHTEAYYYFPGYMEGNYQKLSEADESGWCTIRVKFERMKEAQRVVLGLGAHVEVIEPMELREAVFEAARAMLAHYGELLGITPR